VRLVKLGLATVTVIFGALCAWVAVVVIFDYRTCRSHLGWFIGAERLVSTWACNYDLRIGLWAAGLCLAFGVASCFLLRSRWRGRAKLAAASVSN